MRKACYLLLFFVISASHSFGQTVFWQEDFGTGCNQGQLLTAYSGTNGSWTLGLTGTNGAEKNEFFVSATENGNASGSCGSGCGSNRTLHIGANDGFFTDPGAAYNAGGGCGFLFCVATDIRAESPTINCTGRSNITLSFNYIEFGDGVTDNATLWYFNGATWSQLVDLPKTPCCGGPCNGSLQARWTKYTIALPASANNNANVKIGYRWVNNDDGVGTDPSFAVDSIQLIVPTSGPIPVADFSASDSTLCVGQCINFTDLSTNTPTSWKWYFPGGTPATSNVQNPTNICYNTAGTYQVSLVAINANGQDSIAKTAFINVVACPTPVADFSASDSTLCTGQCISFTDLSTNSPTGWTWYFAGGTPATSNLQNPTNICYNSPGTYNVTLVATNSNGQDSVVKSSFITVTNCPTPIANWSSSDSTFCEGTCINFTDLSTNNPTGWTWYFPGGTPATSNVQNPTNICYNTAGTYNVTLVATNSFGQDSVVKTSFITVNSCPAPVANFSASDSTICAGDCINFTDLSTNSPTSWTWYFNGGTPATSASQNPTNICFNTPGTYTISLVATNANGQDSIAKTSFITVNACNPPTSGIQSFPSGICRGQCVTFNDASIGATAWQWTFTGGTPGSSSAQNPGQVCWDTVGTFTVQLIASNTAGSDTTTTTITVSDIPSVVASADQTIIAGGSTTISATGTPSGGTYLWAPPNNIDCITCASTKVYPEDSTMYFVTYTLNGCSATDTVIILVDVKYNVGVPNAFSPNGSGKNDILYVRGFGIEAMNFNIYNRYGQQVFNSTDQSVGWDGTHNGKEVNPGVFVWTLTVSFKNGTTEDLKGNVTLVR